MTGKTRFLTASDRLTRTCVALGTVAVALLAMQLLLSGRRAPAMAKNGEGGAPEAQAGTIRIRPDPAAVDVGETVTVEVWLEDVADYYGVDVRLAFDPALVQVPAGEVTPLWDIFDQGNHFTLVNKADNVNGTLQYAVTNLNPAQPFTGTGRICAMTFSGITSGATALEFTYVKGSTRRGVGLYPTPIDGEIVIGGVENTPPVANDDEATVNEDSADNAIDVLGNDYDADGDDLSVSSVAQPASGSVTNNATDLSYTPNPDVCGSDTFTYTVSDDQGGSDSATVSVTVTCLNDDPVANDDEATVDEDSADNAIDVLGNDHDADGDDVSVSSVAQPASGSVTNNATDLSYTPNPDVCGSDTFTYTVSDGQGGSDSATVSVTVTCLNDDPVANDDEAIMDENSTDNIIDVLANDDDPDGNELSISSVQQPTNGSVTNNMTDVSYTPDPDVCGSDTFTYTVSDGSGGSDTATVTVTVICLSGPPMADAGGPYSGYTTETVTLDATGSLDPDGSDLAYVWKVDGSTVYSGIDSTYDLALGSYSVGKHLVILTVTDDGGASDVDGTTLTVVNHPPVARDDEATTDEDTPVTVAVTGNDWDPDGSVDATKVGLITGPEHGVVEVDPVTGILTYTPESDFSGTDALTYTVADDRGAGSNEATVDITVIEVNDPPLANDDDSETGKERPVGIDVTRNDRDVDGTVDDRSVSVVMSPDNGSLTLGATGVVTYTPDSEYVGKDVFTYTVQDDDGATSNEAAVTVTVHPAPTILSLDPMSVTAGAPAFTLVVDGQHFVVGSTVHWAAAPRVTTAVSSTRLLAEVTAADIASEGVFDVRVVNPAPLGNASNELPFTVRQAPEDDWNVFLPLVVESQQ